MKVCRVLIIFFLGAALLYASDPWKSKAPEKWDKDDVDKILKDSPWSKVVATGYTVGKEQEKTQSGGGRGTTSPFDSQGGGPTQASEFARVIWWSAKTPRRAMIRQIELGGMSVAPEQAQKFSESVMEDHVFSLEDNASRKRSAQRLTPDQLMQAAWIEIPSKHLKVDCTKAEVIKDQRGGVERIIFMFPRQIDGKPTLDADSGKVIFKWKIPELAGGGRGPGKSQEAKAQEPAEVKFGDAKQFEASFDTKKMVLSGKIDD